VATSYFSKIHFNIIYPSIFEYPKWFHLFRRLDENSVRISRVPRRTYCHKSTKNATLSFLAKYQSAYRCLQQNLTDLIDNPRKFPLILQVQVGSGMGNEEGDGKWTVFNMQQRRGVKQLLYLA
jgi:uncharacterized protein (DUF342 family)